MHHSRKKGEVHLLPSTSPFLLMQSEHEYFVPKKLEEYFVQQQQQGQELQPRGPENLNGAGSGSIIEGREGELNLLPSTSLFLLKQPELADYLVHNGKSQDEEWFAEILVILIDDPTNPIDELFYLE